MRAVITCVLCQKPRCVYAQNALSKILKDEIINLEEDGEYSCGGALVDEDHHMRHSVVVRRQLNCSSPMETTYYSAHIQLPQACTYCGGTSDSLLKEDKVIDELKRKHMTVRLEFLSIIKTMDMNNASTKKVFIIYYSIAFDNLAN